MQKIISNSNRNNFVKYIAYDIAKNTVLNKEQVLWITIFLQVESVNYRFVSDAADEINDDNALLKKRWFPAG